MNGGTEFDVKSCTNKARHKFAVLKPISREISKDITLRIKITNAKSVLLDYTVLNAGK